MNPFDKIINHPVLLFHKSRTPLLQKEGNLISTTGNYSIKNLKTILWILN